MNATITLDPKELAEAIRLYLATKGYEPTEQPRFDVKTDYPDHGQGSPHPVFTGATVKARLIDRRESSSTAYLRDQGY